MLVHGGKGQRGAGAKLCTRMTVLCAVLFGGASEMCVGCHPTYAPPISTIHHGVPGRFVGGGTELGMGGTIHATGGPWAAVSLGQNLRLEAGLETTPIANVESRQGWLLARAGLRATLLQPKEEQRWKRHGPAMDIEIGVGAGFGGEHEDEDDDYRSLDRAALGAYVGGGLGYHFVNWLALFVRVREQVTRAQAVPVTFWTTAVGGPEFTIGPVGIYVAGGYAEYRNAIDHEAGGTLELGLSACFSTGQ